MTRSDPLHIATVPLPPPDGRIGITLCPGKQDPGRWDRDLAVDLDAIRDWGAAAVVTLMEDHELAMLKVADLGSQVRRRHMDWIHLPIRDVSVPSAAVEARWATEAEGLRARLRSGFDVLVHCRGGLGRSGMMAARLMVELGIPAEQAIEDVRRVRPGAIETRAQEDVVQRAAPVPEALPSRDAGAIRDRAVGALLGLATGDAVGAAVEFQARDSFEPLDDMIGGGPFGLQPGQWTDDTSLALALADSLAERGGLDERDLMTRFVAWRSQGRYSCTGACFDIGNTTAAALSRFARTGDPVAGEADASQSGNGSLMRLSPVAIRYWNAPDLRRDAAARQSRTTHGAPEAVDACIVYADMLADAIVGKPRSAILRERDEAFAGLIGAIARGSWRGKPRPAVRSSGYVAHSLEAAIWSVARTADFESAILLASNLGDDADTTAAVAGQLAGAIYGASGIPIRWRERVAWSDRIAAMAETLFEAAGSSRS